MKDIILDFPQLGRYEKGRKQGIRPSVVMGLNQKILLRHHVIYWWQIEEGLDGICTLKFNFKSKKWDNAKGEYSCYQIKRNAEERPELVKLS